MKNLLRPLLAVALSLAANLASAAPSCSATYATRNDWATGFVVDVVVTNAGPATVSGWNVKWTYGGPVALTSAPWGANVTISGNTVTGTDNGSHPSIPAGGTVSYGMSLSYTGARPTPGPITVNGTNCVTTAIPALYVDPQSTAAIWVRNNPADGRAADINARIATQPGARWFGNWSGDIGYATGSYVGAAAANNRMPALVAYNIPARDCGQYSAGGAGSLADYQNWISAFAGGIANRDAIVILEPDAIPQLDCLDANGKAARLQLLQFAVNQFKTQAPRALVYLDIGNSAWLAPAEAATRLYNAGIANAHGFSLNVSNYRSDAESNAYGNAVRAALQQQRGWTKPFVVDTSRNGNGPNGTLWCDPAGRKIGVAPRVNAAGTQPEMTLWIKSPGESDGCAAAAGTFSPDLAYKLIYGY
ncbi:endoglucanase [Duganella sp. CF517]|uniref:glycoside hydrolase family 6 protein n=1 Tax=Duganella sp. CF517 TaxID=1881038 RepID=UPI0008B40643|nr:glycoside hydrolase family 6 protein [Duganella sp. CF517]SEO09115.1 endoglucanase [Duganella sp. CF517]